MRLKPLFKHKNYAKTAHLLLGGHLKDLTESISDGIVWCLVSLGDYKRDRTQLSVSFEIFIKLGLDFLKKLLNKEYV